jgi:iron complex transport system substrate-binding protein
LKHARTLSVRRILHLASFLLLWLLGCHERPVATIKDDLQRDVAVPARVRRIVTLAPNLTEMVFAIGAGDRLVGVDDSSNFPAEAKPLPKVGGMQPSIEKIAALKPDLVIASTEGNHPNLVPALAAASIPLFVVRTDRLGEITTAMRHLGKVLDAPRGEQAARSLDRAIASQKQMRSRPLRILFAVWTDPLYVAGMETFTHDIVVLTGARNAVQVTGWPQYSLESLVAAPPDLILYPRGAVTPEQIEVLRQRTPGMNAEIIAVDEDVFQRPGPRVAEAAKALNAILDARSGGHP